MDKLREKRMSPEIKRYIVSRALDSDDSRELLADRLENEIKQKFLDEKPPAHETLIKMISAARNHEPSHLDIPWHLGTLNDNSIDIPTDAVPYILEALKNKKMLTSERLVTIRQARWIARLYSAIQEKDDLFAIAWYYALNERVSEISKTSFDTSKYDLKLKKPKELIEFFENETTLQIMKHTSGLLKKLPAALKWLELLFL